MAVNLIGGGTKLAGEKPPTLHVQNIIKYPISMQKIKLNFYCSLADIYISSYNMKLI